MGSSFLQWLVAEVPTIYGVDERVPNEKYSPFDVGVELWELLEESHVVY